MIINIQYFLIRLIYDFSIEYEYKANKIPTTMPAPESEPSIIKTVLLVKYIKSSLFESRMIPVRLNAS